MGRDDKVIDFNKFKDLRRKQKIKELEELIEKCELNIQEYSLESWPDELIEDAIKHLKF